MAAKKKAAKKTAAKRPLPVKMEPAQLADAKREVKKADARQLEIPGSRGTSVLLHRKGRLIETGGRRGVRTVRRVVSYLQPALWAEFDAHVRGSGITLSEGIERSVKLWLAREKDL